MIYVYVFVGTPHEVIYITKRLSNKPEETNLQRQCSLDLVQQGVHLDVVEEGGEVPGLHG